MGLTGVDVSKEMTNPLACSLDSASSWVFIVLRVSMVDWVSSSVGLGEELLLDLEGEEGGGISCLREAAFT